MLTISEWRLLVVDDDKEICDQIKEFFEDHLIQNKGLSITPTTNFNEALTILENQRFDLIILDVREGPHSGTPEDEIGIVTLNKIKEKRFLPIIFHTGLPHLVEHLSSSLIRVVPKEEIEDLRDEVQEVITSNLPIINRALIHRFEEIQRQYMWEFVSENWSSISSDYDNKELAYLLARRVSLSLSGEEILACITEMEITSLNSSNDQDVVQTPPITYYIIPPISEYPRPGDLYVKDEENDSSYWIILNPSCDFVVRNSGKCKVDYILLAKAERLSEQDEYLKWKSSQSSKNKKERELENLIKDNRSGGQRERYYFLPGVCNFPNLLVDFQAVVSLPFSDITKEPYNHLASLDSPYAEALVTKFSRYFGRVGKPDVDAKSIISKLQEDMID